MNGNMAAVPNMPSEIRHHREKVPLCRYITIEIRHPHNKVRVSSLCTTVTQCNVSVLV
jgi:hypothetical protein